MDPAVIFIRRFLVTCSCLLSVLWLAALGVAVFVTYFAFLPSSTFCANAAP